MTAEFNLVQQGQEIGPTGASTKVRKGDAGGEAEGLMPFACIMGSAQRTVSQEEGKLSLDTPPDKGEVEGHSDKGSATGRREGLAKGLKNILVTEKGTTQKTDQVIALKGAVLAEGSNKAARKGEAAKENISLTNASKGDKGAKALKTSAETSEGGEAKKGSTPFTGVSKGAETGTDRTFPDVVAVRSEKGGKGQIVAGKGDLPKGVIPEGSKAKNSHPLTGGEPKSSDPKVQKIGVQKTGVQTGGPGVETATVAAPKDEALSMSRGTWVAASAGERIGNKKGITTPFKRGDMKETSAPAERLRPAEDTPGPLKSSLKKAAAVQGKVTVFQSGESGTGKDIRTAEVAPEAFRSDLRKAVSLKEKGAAEKGRTQRASYTPSPDSGKNDIGNQPVLKNETATVGYEKTGGRKAHDHTATPPRRETAQSASPVERDFAVGGYQQTALHAGGRTAAPAGNAGITPRALIDQVAGGAKMSGRVRIALNPPSLGTLDMDVLVRDNNKVHVILQAENNDVRQMLQSHMESLKGSLRSQGLIADTIQVFAQEKTDGNTYGSGQNETLFGESNNQGRNNRERGDGGNFSDRVSSLPKEETPRVHDDGRISLFA